MLEFTNKYSIKEITYLKDFITVIYILIDDTYQKIAPARIKERRNIKDAILSDSEIITISIEGIQLIFMKRDNAKDPHPK